nr:ribonuclease H [Ipomoea batatas]
METHEAFKINNIDDVRQSPTGNFSIPLQEWFFINTDASFLSYDELTGCGGILRTCNGDWVAGFSCTTRVRNIEEGEAWAIYKALQWAWEKKIMNLWIRNVLTVKESRLLLVLAKNRSDVPCKVPEDGVLSAAETKNPVLVAAAQTVATAPLTCLTASASIAMPPLSHAATVVPIPKAATSNIRLSKVSCSNSQAVTLSAAMSKIPPTNLAVYSGPSSYTQDCKSTVAQMEKMLLEDKKLLQSFEADDVDSAPTR